MNLISEAVLSKLTAVSKVRASTEVVRQVRAHIEDGTFQEGHRQPAKRELADRLGVSRPVVREARASSSTRTVPCGPCSSVANWVCSRR